MSFRKPFAISRRAVLRGAGVAITLPWLESLLPRAARAQEAKVLPRFLPIYLPNGAPDLWKPTQTGTAEAWALSSVLELLKPLKSQVAVVSGFETGSVFNADALSYVAPEHGLPTGAWLTCEDSRAVRERLQVDDANGVSFDQLLATFAPAVGGAPLASLQVGLSSTRSYCDSEPCSLSRSVSWRTPTEPTGKLVDPKLVFRQLVGAAAPPETPEQTAERVVQQSVLDAVGESALSVRSRLGVYDQARLDEFLHSLRSVEQRITQLPSERPLCRPATLPVFPNVGDVEYRQNTAEYSKARHADLMNDLIALAFQCNLTRVVSYMLEDDRSEFTYDHVGRRTFTAEGSVPTDGVCGEYRGASHGDPNEYASITWWNVGKVAALCQSLAGIVEDDFGNTVLDNTVVFLGSSLRGSDHRIDRLPALLVGGRRAGLHLDQHVDLGKRPLRDLYYTLANSVYGMDLASFGVDRTGASHATVTELLAR